jgi:tetratricopeptide (TPR) repeat protein
MKCLEKDRSRRYETVNGLAMDVQRYLNDEPVHACPPTMWYRYRKFARRNKLALVMASFIALALLLAVGSLGWVVRDREALRARTAVEVNQFLQRAEALHAENKLPEAVAEVEKARGVLEAGSGDEELKRRVRQWLKDLDMATTIEEISQQRFDIADSDQHYAIYARVFREYGIDVDALSVDEATTRIASSKICYFLADTLGAWAWQLRRDPRAPEARWQRMAAIAHTADPDPFRLRLERAAWVGDLKTLRELADEADVGRVHPRALQWLGTALTWAGDPDAGVALLRKAQRQHPGYFGINESLARNLSELKPPPWDEVIAFRRVALALRPKSAAAHSALGYALRQNGRIGEAIDAHREAIRLAPRNPDHTEMLGWNLQSQGRFPEMEAAFREVVRLRPDHAAGHHGLGRALLAQKKSSEAIASLRKAVRLGSTDHWVHEALGWALVEQGEAAEAEAAFREVVRLKPELAHGYFGLGRALVEQKKFVEAETELREALLREPAHPWAPQLLHRALVGQGKSAEAEELEKKSGRKTEGAEKKEKPE